MMRKFFLMGFLLSATAAYAQLAEPQSEQSGNILAGSPELASQLPAPPAGTATVSGLLGAAITALQQRHTGAAQEALEQAETLALDRAIPQSAGIASITDPLVMDIFQARQALGAHNMQGALAAAMAAQTLANPG